MQTNFPIQSNLCKRSASNVSPFPGNNTFAASLDFFDNTFTFYDHSSNITCCHWEGTPEEAACGKGASCEGQCAALGASLCPSGMCTEDPRSCEIVFNNSTEESPSGGGGPAPCAACQGGSNLKRCTGGNYQCKVREHPECCFYQPCLAWTGRKEACDWLAYLHGNDRKSPQAGHLILHLRKSHGCNLHPSTKQYTFAILSPSNIFCETLWAAHIFAQGIRCQKEGNMSE